jgi:hypothetical protein
MPPILHGVIRERRWPFSATGSRLLPASGGYCLSAEAQLHPYALIRNIQGGSRRTEGPQTGRKHPPFVTSELNSCSALAVTSHEFWAFRSTPPDVPIGSRGEAVTEPTCVSSVCIAPKLLCPPQADKDIKANLHRSNLERCVCLLPVVIGRMPLLQFLRAPLPQRLAEKKPC